MQSSVAVALGVVVGATARWALGETIGTNGFPWSSLVANLIGCAAIGWFAMRLQRGTAAWYFVVTGVLGGFTTASAFAVETRQLLDDGRAGAALAYLVASVAGGIGAVALVRRSAEERAAA